MGLSQWWNGFTTRKYSKQTQMAIVYKQFERKIMVAESSLVKNDFQAVPDLREARSYCSKLYRYARTFENVGDVNGVKIGLEECVNILLQASKGDLEVKTAFLRSKGTLDSLHSTKLRIRRWMYEPKLDALNYSLN